MSTFSDLAKRTPPISVDELQEKDIYHSILRKLTASEDELQEKDIHTVGLQTRFSTVRAE